MNEKFTPAPWKVEKMEKGPFCGVWADICDASGKIISFIWCSDAKQEQEEKDANANIIAVAPEMYACLKRIKMILEDFGLDALKVDDVRMDELIDRVLKKARNES